MHSSNNQDLISGSGSSVSRRIIVLLVAMPLYKTIVTATIESDCDQNLASAST